jgi:uncharacterized protein YgiM (DUF1202 family)
MGENLGWVAGDFLSPTDGDGATVGIPIGSQVRVTSGNLNWREEPGLDGAIITTLDAGQKFWVDEGPVRADGYDWYRIYPDAPGSGWVAGDFIAVVGSDGDFQPGDVIRVDTDGLNLRTEPGLAGNVIAVLPQGGNFAVEDGPIAADGYTWYQVRFESNTGWIAGEFVIASTGA